MTEATILVVEDDGILAMHLEDLLTRQGYTVLVPAATGEEAIWIVKKQKPSLVLMDIELGGEMNGISTAEQIGTFTDTPVIFLTGFSQDPLLQQARIAAPYGYLVKPVPERELAATIEMALYKHKLDHQVRESEARYHSLVEQASDGIFLSDPQGNYIEVNSAGCAMLGYSREELLRLNMRDIIPPADLAEIPLRLPELQHGAILRSERRFRRKNGTVFPVEISGKMLQDGNMQGIVRDITERKQMEKVLNETSAILQAALDNSQAGIAIADAPDGKLRYVNKAGLLIPAKTKDELVNGVDINQYVSSWQILHFDGTPFKPEEVPLARAVLYAETSSKEFIIRRADSNDRYVLANAAPILNEAGQVKAGIVVFLDITERKQAEEALRESKQFAQATIDALPFHICVLDHNGVIISANRAWREFAQANGAKDPNFFIGVNYLAMCDQSRGADSQGAAEFARGIRSIMNGRRQQYVQEYICNSPAENRWFLGKVVRFVGEQGQLHLVVSHENITGSKQAEEVIRESEERLRLAQEAANAGAWEWDLVTNQNTWSEKLWNLYGLEPNSCQPSFDTWLQSIHPNDRVRVERIVQEAASNGTELNAEWRVFLPDGQNRWLMSRGKPHREANGQVTRYVGVVIDITERKQMEEELLEEKALLAQKIEERTADLRLANTELLRSARIKDEFLASMSHELRTPLTGILGLSEALQLNIYGELKQKQLDSIQSIEKSGKHLLTLINDILDLSKVGAGMIALDLKTVSVRDICRSSIQMIKQISHEKQIKTQLIIEDGVDYFLADERRLKQILVNLLINAVKFSPEGSAVGLDVRGDIENKRILFTVWDQGIGIAPQDLTRLFQPFTQLDSALSRQYAGTGLGLSLVLKMVELHGGGISVQSEPGKGSRFVVTLPWQNIQAQKTAESPLQTTNQAEARVKMTDPLILIVEDNQLYLYLLVDILTNCGYRVITATNGEEGIAQAREKRPDLILMDIQMPILDGLQATLRIRSDPSMQKTPIIALTALAMSGDREKCIEAGMNDYLSKPVNIGDLKKAIETLIHHDILSETHT